MSDIYYFTEDSFPDDEPLDSYPLAQMFRDGGYLHSQAHINGYLDGANQASTMSVTSHKLRPRTSVFGKMEGLTGNFDFHGDKVFAKRYTNTGAFVPLPGAAISFWLPEELPQTIIFTWTVFGANATKFEKKEDDEKITRMRFYVNGVSTEGTRVVPSSRHGHNGYDPETDTTGGDAQPHRAWRRPHRDRVWSGHHMTGRGFSNNNLVKGWNHAWIGVHNEEQTARFRVRNMKAIWFY